MGVGEGGGVRKAAAGGGSYEPILQAHLTAFPSLPLRADGFDVLAQTPEGPRRTRVGFATALSDELPATPDGGAMTRTMQLQAAVVERTRFAGQQQQQPPLPPSPPPQR